MWGVLCSFGTAGEKGRDTEGTPAGRPQVPLPVTFLHPTPHPPIRRQATGVGALEQLNSKRGILSFSPSLTQEPWRVPKEKAEDVWEEEGAEDTEPRGARGEGRASDGCWLGPRALKLRNREVGGGTRHMGGC